MPLLLEVSVNLRLVAEIVTDHRVNVGQLERGILLRNLLCGGAFAKSGNDGVQRNAGVPHAHDAVLIGCQRNGFWRNHQRHRRYLTILHNFLRSLANPRTIIPALYPTAWTSSTSTSCTMRWRDLLHKRQCFASIFGLTTGTPRFTLGTHRPASRSLCSVQRDPR